MRVDDDESTTQGTTCCYVMKSYPWARNFARFAGFVWYNWKDEDESKQIWRGAKLFLIFFLPLNAPQWRKGLRRSWVFVNVGLWKDKDGLKDEEEGISILTTQSQGKKTKKKSIIFILSQVTLPLLQPTCCSSFPFFS